MSRSIISLHRSCTRCCHPIPNRSSLYINRSLGSSSRYLQDSESSTLSNPTIEGEEGKKINTWFLTQPPRPTTPSSSSSSSFPQSSKSNPPFSTTLQHPTPFQPQDIPPIPPNTPQILLPLHQFLTSSNSEASEVIHGNTVQIYDTSKLINYMETKGQGDLVGDGENIGNLYNWIITVQVKGRGRGVVARGDGVLRRWLLKNPLHPSIPASPHEYPKTPRISLDSDWSIVPLNLGPPSDSNSTSNIRACVNLLSEEGKERWKLDEMWGNIPIQ